MRLISLLLVLVSLIALVGGSNTDGGRGFGSFFANNKRGPTTIPTGEECVIDPVDTSLDIHRSGSQLPCTVEGRTSPSLVMEVPSHRIKYLLLKRWVYIGIPKYRYFCLPNELHLTQQRVWTTA